MDTIKFILVVVLGCVMIQTIAAECEWVCESTPTGVVCGLKCSFKRSAEARRGVPCAFRRYDLDHDGLVTMTELNQVLSSTMKDHTIKATFYMMDGNDDGIINVDEFGAGPLAKVNCS